MTPPIPLELQCGHPMRKHDGTGRVVPCVLGKGHKDVRHRDQEYIEMRRRTDTPERRKRYRSHNHGLPSDWYETQLAKQDGKCAICRKTPEQNGMALAVDHDHACCPGGRSTCGKCVRGLLCNDCNQMLGRAKDDPRILLAAVAYLS